ncbi:MAG: hypothetical protein IPJ04_13445 [Candidatus Eisenbacteria bacterium]|nr:hypothetical protein [Candidatus Eisenbacteria bacterium]
MTLLTLALVLASAVVHATWNLWAKQIGPTARQAALVWMLTGISSVCYAPFALWLYAHGTWRPSPLAIGVTAASGAIHIVYFLLLSGVSRRRPVARVPGRAPARCSRWRRCCCSPRTPAFALAHAAHRGRSAAPPSAGRRPHAHRAGTALRPAHGRADRDDTLWDGWR